MSRVRAASVGVLVVAMLLGGPGVRAFADISNSTGTNVQGGDNRGTGHQGGKSASGDAVGGQVTGVVAAGRTSVDATNVSKDSSVQSGDAHGSNTSNSFVGLSTTSDGGKTLVGSTTDLSFIGLAFRANLQEGSNRQTLAQTANASTGDGVAGEVIGVVTAAGGSASVVAANTTSNSDVTSGDAHADNASDAFVGLANSAGELGVATDISNVSTPGSANVQQGTNRQTLSQSSSSTTGDGVAGQVIGVVSAGATSVDANNTSDNVAVQTGDARSTNTSGAFVGVAFANDGQDIEVNGSDISNVDSPDHLNVQEGNNQQTARQAATATTGDGVAGEVIGAVTSAGGSASIVAANTSKNSDVQTGDARATNGSASFVGLALSHTETEIGTGDISGIHSVASSNIQEGNDRQTLTQSSTATTGDGVAGQVIGAVSAGATSIDARNTSDNVDVTTGDASTSNRSNAFVGLARSVDDQILLVIPGDISGINLEDSSLNLQEGDNRQTASQSAKASSGDGVAGEVIGAVTSAGGSTSIVAANTSTNSSVTTGDARADNNAGAFVGLARANDAVLVVPDDISGVTSGNANIQQGGNRQTLNQSSTASTGDGVAGQVMGAVSAGATSIDARNLSDNVDVSSGDADSSNTSAAFVGLSNPGTGFDVGATDISGVTGSTGARLNVQEGSNRQTLSQTSSASTGDGVAGEVIGVVTSAGGSASVVAANTSKNSDASSGDANATNNSNAFVGLADAFDEIDVGDISGVTTTGSSNVQQGSNRQTLSQSATASTGDGIAGQVIGVVSAGRTSVDATNLTDDSSAASGDSRASNSSSSFVGLAVSSEPDPISVGEVSNVTATNIQDGNNRQTLAQSADASSGDAVSGQVLAGVTAGVITGAGGTVSVVVANTSTSIDSSTGDTRFDNSDGTFVGQAVGGATTVTGLA